MYANYNDYSWLDIDNQYSRSGRSSQIFVASFKKPVKADTDAHGHFPKLSVGSTSSVIPQRTHSQVPRELPEENSEILPFHIVKARTAFKSTDNDDMNKQG